MAEYQGTPTLSKIKIGTTTYYLKDAAARAIIDGILSDYLTSADKTELQTQISGNAYSIEQLEDRVSHDEDDISELAGEVSTVLDKTVELTDRVRTVETTVTRLDGAETVEGSVKKQIADAIKGVTQFDFQVVDTLPATGKKGTIYLVPHLHGATDIYDEYIYVNDTWEKIGSTDVDLSNYYTKAQADAKFATIATAQIISGAKTFSSAVTVAAGGSVTPGLIVNTTTGGAKANGGMIRVGQGMTVSGDDLGYGTLSARALTINSSGGVGYNTTIDGTQIPKNATLATTDDIKIEGIKLNGSAVTITDKVADLGELVTNDVYSAFVAVEDQRFESVMTGLGSQIAAIGYTDGTHNIYATRGDGTLAFSHTFGSLADKSSVSGSATITHTATDITLSGKFTPTGTVAVTLKDNTVLGAVSTAGSCSKLTAQSTGTFAKKVLKPAIAADDAECLVFEYVDVVAGDSSVFGSAVTDRGTFTEGSMPTFSNKTVAVNSATFTGDADQSVSTTGKYDKANGTAAVSAS